MLTVKITYHDSGASYIEYVNKQEYKELRRNAERQEYTVELVEE